MEDFTLEQLMFYLNAALAKEGLPFYTPLRVMYNGQSLMVSSVTYADGVVHVNTETPTTN